MQNLFFRNRFVLGVLMVCVLALGVQGSAEAIEKPSSPPSTEDLNPVEVYNVGREISIPAITLTPDKPGTNETVSITKSSSSIALIGNFYGLSSVTLTEDEDTDADPRVNSNTFTYKVGDRKETLTSTTGPINIRFIAKGKHTVTISSTDNEDPNKGSWSYKYTFYVKGSGTSTTTVSLKGLSSGYKKGLFSGTTNKIEVHSGDSNHYDVTYTTVPNTGTLEIVNAAGTLTALAATNRSSVFDLWLTMNRSYQVNARVKDSDIITTGAYIIGSPKLTVGYPDNPDGLDTTTDTIAENSGAKTAPGRINATLNNAFTARVTGNNITDEASTETGITNSAPGVVVKFQVKGSGIAGGYLVFDSISNDDRTINNGILVSSNNRRRLNSSGRQLTRATDKILYVRTTGSGQADVDFQLGTDRKQDVTISAVGQSQVVSAYAGTTASGNQLVTPESKSSQAAGHSGEYELRVKAVNEDEEALRDEYVEFRTNDGILTNPRTGATNSLGRIGVRTDTQGIAFVFFDPKGSSSSPRVTAHLLDLGTSDVVGGVDDEADKVIDDVVFNPKGVSNQQQNQNQNQQSTNTITLSPSSLSGTIGQTRTLTISNPAGISVTLSSPQSGLPQSNFSPATGTGTSFTSTVTLPSTAGSYTILASGTIGGRTISDSVTATVTAPGSISLALTGTENNGAQDLQVTVRDADRSLASGTVIVTLSGAGISRTVTTTNGTGRVPIPLPLTRATLTARATGYDDGTLNLPARTTTPSTGTGGQPSDTPDPDPDPEPTAASEPSRINIVGSATRSDNTANQQLDAPLLVQVVDGDGDGVEDIRVIFRVREGQGRLSQRGNGRATTAQTDSRGHARVDYTPISASSTVEAEVRGVTRTVTFTITTGADTAATGTTGTSGATRTYKVGDPIPLSTGNTLSFSGSRTVNGTTYTCVGPGECVVSYGLVTRGEIRSATTPTVQAKAYKVGEKIPISLNDTLTFTSRHTVRGTTYTCVGPGECVVSHGLVAKGEIRVVAPTSATTPPRTTEINPVVLVGAAQRPPMVWVDGGAIYALVGASVERFAPSVNNAVNIAVSGGKVYWTEQTGDSGGTINSANLDGSGVTELASIFATPMGIAVDVTNSKLYWTNAAGRIQSANLDGSRITNVMQNLEGVMDLALAGGNAYWTQGGNVRFVNLRGQKQIRNISTGTDTAGSLAIGGGKVYWTEQTGDSGGTVNAANLNGSGARQLASILAMPTGIAVDGSRSKLYWGNARGRIQSANLDGSKIQNVVDGLGSPGDMVISNSLKAPAGTTTAPKTTTAANKYDVNGDGTVDSKDSDALVVAVSAGLTDAKYDVNADGKVDINDVVAVSANRSAGAAGAPTLIGNIKLSAIQIDRLQEQIELLIATGDRSPAAMKTLIYLQQLIATARPEQTQLFANYPNPFNPETWIPYELAMDTNVKITIYASNGVVVRTLPLGQQSAGYYTDRERAAYWDGRNAQGEQVASGVYFYQLETDELSLMRKMVILK